MNLGTKHNACNHLGLVYESIKYVQEAARICEIYIAKHLSKHYRLWKNVEHPFAIGYCPKLDVSPVLGLGEAFYYNRCKEVDY